MADVLVAGGLVVDGTGALPYVADVLIRDTRIHQIAVRSPGSDIALAAAPDAEIRDATGSVVCPGFVDVHTHSDLTVLSSPFAHSKVRQGVTTEVIGNCGLGVAPLPAGADIDGIRQAVSYLDLDPSVAWSWTTTGGHLAALEAARPSLNVATLTGHLPLHAGVVGFGSQPATVPQIDHMRGLLADSFDEGSLGLSTGMVYAPVCYADDAELIGLARVVAERDRVFTWHVRDYADELMPSVEQALQTARRTGCRTQISHLVAVGKRNWGAVSRVLDMVDVARADGCDVSVDIYPYLYGNAPLTQLLPSWAQAGGATAMVERLADRAVRDRIRSAWLDRPTGWGDITVSWLPAGDPAEPFIGRDIAAIAHDLNADGDEVALDLLARLGNAVMIVAGGRSEDDLRSVLNHPATVVASDGLALDPDGITGSGSPHPRSYGCFPRYLTRYAGTSDADLANAIRRCTSAPALLAGLSDRGVLRPGAPADLVVFSRAALVDTATLTDPQQFPRGIDLVLVNGEPVVDSTGHTGARPGQVVRR